MPAPSIAAVLVLLVASALPVAPAQNAREVHATTAASVPSDEPPASMTEVPEADPAPHTPAATVSGPASGRQALDKTGQWSVPEVLLAAYRQAVAGSPPACHLPVSLLAAIGQVESGSLAGRSIDAAHRAVPPVLGPLLDGVGTAAIRDTDGGRLDGSTRWDRAVGPMQFIPGTWAMFGVDGDGDGRADPQNVYDATASAAGYLCAGSRDLARASGLRSAILSYNHSTAYLTTVLAWQQQFTSGGVRTSVAVINAINAGMNTTGRATLYRPTATGVPLIPAGPSTSGNHVVAAAAKLSFTTEPSPAATSGAVLPIQPVVAVQDAAGNTVTTNTSPVTLSLTTPDGATLTCDSNPVAAKAGIASFTGCTIDKAGTYLLTATDGSLTAATSTAVTILAGAPAAVTVLLGSGQSATVGREFTIPLVAQVTDANRNPVPGVTVTFTAPDISAGPSATFATSSAAAAARTDANGRATSGALTANTTAGTYRITATTGSVFAAFTMTNSPGAATRFAIISAPFSGPVSATATLGPITVQLQDTYNNPAPAPTGGIDVTLSSDSAGTSIFASTLAGISIASLTIPGGESDASFYYGDSQPGSPIITTSGPLVSAIQNETITADAVPPPAATSTAGP